MGLITTDDLIARRVGYSDATQAQAAIDDASAAVRAYVAPVLDSVERGEDPDVPAAVVMVVCGMVRRVLTNPTGLQMETLGDYSYQAMANSATLLPTAREKRILRSAATAFAKAVGTEVPTFGTSSIYMRADLPYPEGAW